MPGLWTDTDLLSTEAPGPNFVAHELKGAEVKQLPQKNAQHTCNHELPAESSEQQPDAPKSKLSDSQLQGASIEQRRAEPQHTIRLASYFD